MCLESTELPKIKMVSRTLQYRVVHISSVAKSKRRKLICCRNSIQSPSPWLLLAQYNDIALVLELCFKKLSIYKGHIEYIQ